MPTQVEGSEADAMDDEFLKVCAQGYCKIVTGGQRENTVEFETIT